MEQVQRLTTILDGETAKPLFAAVHGAIYAAGDGLVLMPQSDQAAIVLVHTTLIANLVRDRRLDLIRGRIGGANGIAHPVVVSPQHRQAAVGIGVFTAAGATHTELLAIVNHR